MELSYWISLYKKDTMEKIKEFLVTGMEENNQLRIRHDPEVVQFLSTLNPAEIATSHERAWEEIPEEPMKVLEAIPVEQENDGISEHIHNE